MALKQVSGVQYSHIVAVVPIEYLNGLDASQTSLEAVVSGINAVDYTYSRLNQLANTNISINLQDADISIPEYFYLHNITNTQTAGMTCFCSGTTIMDFVTGGWASEYSAGVASSNWSVTTIDRFHHVGTVTGNFLTKLTPTAGYKLLGLRTSATEPANYANWCYSASHELRMWDKNAEIEWLFDAGVSYNTASQNQMLKRWTIKWSELTSAQMDTFETFFASFGGDICAPWFLCVIRGDVADTMDSYLVSIEKNSIESSYDAKKNVYSVGFVLLESLVDY